ncbi:F0F1 ATP synthase subunit epsilon [Vogesella oryzae]|uniref:F0F1 ATP synthase subunit epsilon n=1 Tax=Vogesella oryzae TaxID=1735285 RepID=UPI001581CE7D|nr:F0F1 ATP synthase subunit epsilon [Vogesella oryzae]
MNSITLYLNSAVRSECIAGVASFVGTDASGSFGIQPGRARFMTVLDYGLSRFRRQDGNWVYLACPGAVLHFAADRLTLNTRRYLYDADYRQISALLDGQLAAEESKLDSVKANLQQLEQALYQRLRQLDRRPR